jgi:hypothetical protein
MLSALILIPIAAWFYARRFAPQHLATVTGIGLGLVVSPLSMGLYATYFLGPLGIVTGMIGLISGMLHEVPGFQIVRMLGLVPPGIIEGVGHVYVELANAVVWAVAYGALGWVIDRVRQSRIAL